MLRERAVADKLGFCPLCAQYIKSVIRDVSPDALEEAGVELIIIGNGSSKMINGYASKPFSVNRLIDQADNPDKYFNSPFKTYTDPTLALYRTLGLTRQTGDSGLDAEKGDYITETALETTVNTLKRERRKCHCVIQGISPNWEVNSYSTVPLM